MGSLFFFSLGASAKQLRWNELYVGQTESGSSSSAQWLQILWRVSGARWLVETGADVSLDVALTINSPSPEWVLALFMCAWEICPFKKKRQRLLNPVFPMDWSSVCSSCSIIHFHPQSACTVLSLNTVGCLQIFTFAFCFIPAGWGLLESAWPWCSL